MKFNKQYVTALLFFLVTAYALSVSIYRPNLNWDMIMYIAAAKAFEESDINALHAFTYNRLKQSLSAEEYKRLVKGSYRQTISTDPTAFAEQQPFYQIRPMYTGAVFLLYKAGMDIRLATHLISGVAVAVGMILLYLLSISSLAEPYPYVVPLLALFFGIDELAAYSTPDGMAFLAIILSAYLYLRQRIGILLMVLPLMLCIRTDLILFTTPLLLAVFILERDFRKGVAVSFILSVLVYVAVGAYWNNPGWSTIFYFTLVHILSHPISMPPTLTPQHYITALFNGSRGLLDNGGFLLYLLIALVYLFRTVKRASQNSLSSALGSSSVLLFFVCAIFIVSHFVLFPVAWNRFFIGPYMLSAVMLLVMLQDELLFPRPPSA